MPKVNFGGVDDAQDFSAVPKDKYRCRVAKVKEGFTKNGDEMWSLRLRIEDGPYKGRLLFDNLIFSDAAMGRVKMVLSRLGLDVSGSLDVTPSLIMGRTCIVTATVEDGQDDKGNVVQRNRIPFAGYKVDEDAPADPVGGREPAPLDSPLSDDDQVPF